MPRIGTGRLQFGEVLHHPPDFARITPECVDRGILFGIITIPQSTRVTERRNAALSRNTRPSQSNSLAGSADGLGCTFDQVLHVNSPLVLCRKLRTAYRKAAGWSRKRW